MLKCSGLLLDQGEVILLDIWAKVDCEDTVN